MLSKSIKSQKAAYKMSTIQVNLQGQKDQLFQGLEGTDAKDKKCLLRNNENVLEFMVILYKSTATKSLNLPFPHPCTDY